MPSHIRTRRFKPLLAIVVLAVLTVLYLTSSARSTRSSDFYQRTQDALAEQRERNAVADAEKNALGSDVDVAKRLKEAEEKAKAAADRIGDEHRARLGMEMLPDEKEESGAKEKSVAGRKKMPDDEDGETTPAEEARGPVAPPGTDQVPVKEKQGTEQKVETEEEHKVEQELNSILKRSPIIIFSKTYCPYSKKAKRILLDQYKITPAPYVVELDEHELGPKLQSALGESTGRRTVPNVLINGKSIGGGDDVEALHEKGELINTVKSMGGKRIMEARLIESEASPAGQREPKRRRVKR